MANGTIAFDTLTTSDSANTNTEKSIDTSYLLNGTAKVWVNINADGAGTADTFNISSSNKDIFSTSLSSHIIDLTISPISFLRPKFSPYIKKICFFIIIEDFDFSIS